MERKILNLMSCDVSEYVYVYVVLAVELPFSESFMINSVKEERKIEFKCKKKTLLTACAVLFTLSRWFGSLICYHDYFFIHAIQFYKREVRLLSNVHHNKDVLKPCSFSAERGMSSENNGKISHDNIAP